MHSTEEETRFLNEKNALASAAEKVKKSGIKIYPESGEGEDSAFSLPDTALLPEIVEEYDFVTPVRFREKMEEIWEKRGAEAMKAFSVPAAVSAFKGRPAAGEEKKTDDRRVSEYIYEF